MLIAIRNLSTVAAINWQWLRVVAGALERQANEQFCPAWELVPGLVVPIPDGTDIKSVPASGVITIYDDADQQGVLGDHELVRGMATGRVFAKTILDAGGSLDDGAWSVSAVLSHEHLEILGDPYANWWSDHPSGDAVALEVCDPVEDESYEIGDISVSNWVTSRWFREGPGPYDWMGTRLHPYDVSRGGYLIMRETGPQFAEDMPSVRRRMKQAPGSRTRRRT